MPISTIVSSILVNISSSFIFDLLKSFNKRPKMEKISSQLSTFLSEFTDSDVDSGKFDKFLKRQETKTLFNNYIQYRKIETNSELNITRDDFIASIVKLTLEYTNQINDRILDPISLEKYYRKLLEYIENELLEQIPEANKGITCHILNRIDELEKRILDFYTLDIEFDTTYIERLKAKYIQKIRKYYLKEHIYGITTLKLDDFYICPKLTIDNKYNEEEIVYWQDLFNYTNSLSIIGGPGFGKTIFLKNLLLNYKKLKKYQIGNSIPIYIDIKKYVNLKKDFKVTNIFDCINLQLNEFLNEKKSVIEDFSQRMINQGNIILLFDALDEVNEEDRTNVHNEIVTFFEGINANNKLIITSRDREFISETALTLRVNNITDKDIEEYLLKLSNKNYFNKSEINIFITKSKQFLDNNFLKSFLTLSLLVSIYKSEKDLPETKVDLYSKCTDFISNKREQKGKKCNIDFKLIKIILDQDNTFERLAYLTRPSNNAVDESVIMKDLLNTYKKSYIDESHAYNAVQEFLRFCSERTELFIADKDSSNFNFFHLSFFEFYYSKYLINNVELNEIVKLLSEYNENSELFELVTANLKKNNYSKYTNYLDIITNEKNIIGMNKRLSSIFSCVDEGSYISQIYNDFFSDSNTIYDKKNIVDDGFYSIFRKIYNNDKIFDDFLVNFPSEILVIHTLFTLFSLTKIPFFTDAQLSEIGIISYSTKKKKTTKIRKLFKSYSYDDYYKVCIRRFVVKEDNISEFNLALKSIYNRTIKI